MTEVLGEPHCGFGRGAVLHPVGWCKAFPESAYPPLTVSGKHGQFLWGQVKQESKN